MKSGKEVSWDKITTHIIDQVSLSVTQDSLEDGYTNAKSNGVWSWEKSIHQISANEGYD